MHFGFALDMSDIDSRNIDLLDTHLDLLDKVISSKYFVCLQDVFKTCLQDVLKTCLQDVFKTYLQDFLKTSCKMSSRGLEDVLKTSLQDSFKTSWKHFEEVLENERLLRWKRVKDVFKICLEDVLKTSWRPTNFCWEVSRREKKDIKYDI